MGNKIDYRVKSKVNKKKTIIIAVIVLIFIIYIIIQGINRAYKSLPKTNTNKTYYNVSDYSSLEEILNRYNCLYIRTEKSSDVMKIYVTFDRDLYTENLSNENHFLQMARIIAEFENFKNFELIDESKDIDISITCEDTNIVEFKINGDVNYYLNQDSKLNSRKPQTKVTSFTIQSQELQSLIDNDWNDLNVNFGTKDSACDEYNIYFNEGIRYKKVGRQVFNLIFTTKYEGIIAGGLNANSTKEEIIEALGNPTFKYSESEYGYLGDNNYLFFDFINNQVSIYPIQNINNEDENRFIDIIKEMNSSLDIKAFASNLTSLWKDYDEYDYDSNYVDLKYTLRGVELKISNNSLKNGIYIYQNYAGDRSIQDLENVYIKDTDFVADFENQRITNEILKTSEQGDFTEEELAKMGVEFSIRFKSISTSDSTIKIGPMFFSRNKEYPNSELDSKLEVSSGIWYDDYKYIYSVNNDGIYIYNCRTRNNVKIISIEENIKINSVDSNKINYNDNQEININIQ